MEKIQNLSNQDAVKKMQVLIKAADICHFVTALKQLPLNSRPMSTLTVDDEGSIWFFSDKDSDKNKDILEDEYIQLFYANHSSSEYLSVYGTAMVLKDKAKIKELWTPIAKVWFQEGVDDPNITILKVTPLEAYYWDTKHNKLIALLKMAAAVVTGKTMDDGIEGKLKI